MTMRLVVAILLCPALVSQVSATGISGTERLNQPIQIKSNELVTDGANRTATFTGKVTARQGEITINADRLVILYSEGEKGVERIEAIGNVRIVQGNRLGQADHALYDNKGGKIVLDGNPRVYQGDDVVSGKVITYFVDDQRSVVTGGSDGRVEAVIHPREKAKNGPAKP